MPWWNKSNGVTILEAIIAVAVMALVSGSVLGLLWGGLKSADANQRRQLAVGLANQQLEIIKNLPYDSVGTTGGVPSGNLPQTQTSVINNTTYTITTDVHYVDDNYDQKTPNDTLNTDYKRVEIIVTWPHTDQVVETSTLIVPNGIENNATGGTLWLEVYDPTTDPVTLINKATVTILAPTVTPAVSLSVKTDTDGRYILPGAPVGTEAYQITVTKTGYGSARTYTADIEMNPNPNPADLSVAQGEVTTEYFQIARLADSISLHTRDITTDAPVTVAFAIHSDSVIGSDGSGNEIYEYSTINLTDAAGGWQLNDPESGNYTIIFDEAAIGYVVAGTTRDIPFEVLPNANESVTIYLHSAIPFSGLLTVVDANNARLADATVRLYTADLTFDVTQTTTSYGQTFFDTITAGSYLIDVTATGYAVYNGSIIIGGNDEQTIYMATL